MSLNKYRNEVKKFLDDLGQHKADEETIIKMLESELAKLKKSLGNKPKVSHQIYDILFLLLEISAIYNCDLNNEWRLGREKKKQKLIKIATGEADKYFA